MLHQSLNRGLIIEIIKFLSQFIIHPSSLRVFCDNCKIEFYSADELIRHIKHEHQRNEVRQPVVRFSCGKSYTSPHAIINT
mmetsp:Transcript_30166/g.48421  ORF Transcript_30166/g.48421 Transcript_30166/m.48421 type:complete len:81 (+) Transcript_30166:994-1236(+)